MTSTTTRTNILCGICNKPIEGKIWRVAVWMAPKKTGARFTACTNCTNEPNIAWFKEIDATYAERIESYQARREAKADRFAGYADHAAERSKQASAKAHAIMDLIPLGQPILVGHHSEKHARRDQDKIQNGIMQSVEESKRAAYWDHRAASVENDTAIHSGDPEAIEKLDAKIAELEATAERRKLINATIRKQGYAAAVPLMTAEDKADLLSVARYQSYYKPEEKGFPPYATTNLRANLRRYQQRRDGLVREATAPTRTLRSLIVKYAGNCEACGKKIARGEVATYDKAARALYCNIDCANQ